MPSVLPSSAVLLAAGAVAGAVGAAGGITSLVSYSALLAVGVPPLGANVANLVAAVACWPGSALTSRRELADVKCVLTPALTVASCGAAAGAALLLNTPPGTFSRVVPFLVAAASLVLLAQPWLTARLRSQRHRARALTLPLLGLVAIYAGYFGAGSGILLLAVLLVLIDDRLPAANAIKNMMLGVGATVSAVIFVVGGPVDWAVVLPLAAGLFVGSAFGPVIARRVPSTVVRWVVAALGIVLAAGLWRT
ncbi:hypothetical protein HNR02_002088 [Amycolatopsis endophytica]|uniref:Probable membrane transporter protein n=1 Tax=Amycolatopsis endophytica TaxID=860233 RepID=A0A853B1P5_9PSEU|nr:sulfite exporter TauE/SafE family protein [Amycolatopsis endophytica]NYI88765.1 hypothetical protein [Amycolatopsis endophytica]